MNKPVDPDHSRCSICHRLLVSLESRQRGIGPVCWAQLHPHALKPAKSPKVLPNERQRTFFPIWERV